MITRIVLLAALTFIVVEVSAQDSLESKIEKLDAMSMELLGIPLNTLQDLVSVGSRGIFTDKNELVDYGHYRHFQPLIDAGYLQIEKAPADFAIEMPMADDLVHVKLTEKGREIVDAFDLYQYNKKAK